MLECAEVGLQISRSEGQSLVDELLMNLQRAELDFSTFRKELKSPMHYSQIISVEAKEI